MKYVSAIGQRAFLLLSLLVLMAWATGCATKNKVDWRTRVGNYTFDHAVMEYGPPDKQATLQDGTLVADWLLRRGYTQSSPGPMYYPGPYGYYPFYPAYNDIHVPDYFLRLTFGPDGKLTAWKNFVR